MIVIPIIIFVCFRLGIGVIMWALMKATNETQEARHYKKIEALLTAEA